MEFVFPRIVQVLPIFFFFFCDNSIFFLEASESNALVLKSLDFYCACTGQQINFEKSGLISNSSFSLKLQIQHLLYVNVWAREI